MSAASSPVGARSEVILVDRGGRRLRVAVDGTRGSPLVLLPNCHVPFGALVWAAELARWFRVARVDLNGFGDSDSDPTTFGLDGAVEDLVAVADALDSERFSVWGYSGNAPVSLAAAIGSDRVAAAVAGGFPVFQSGAMELDGGPPEVGYFQDHARFQVAAYKAILGQATGPSSPITIAGLGASNAAVLLYHVRDDTVLETATAIEAHRRQLDEAGVTVAAIDVDPRHQHPLWRHNTPSNDPLAGIDIISDFLRQSAR